MSELTDEQRNEIMAALAKQQKITAIKLYREATGLGLKEAKEFIDALQKRLHQESPEEYAMPKTIGCLVVLFGVFLLHAMMWLHIT